MTWLALGGWLLALGVGGLALGLRRRFELVASAEHELRGPLAALTLAAARRRPLEPAIVEAQVARARLALADLAAARQGRRASPHAVKLELRQAAERAAASWRSTGAVVTLDWRAGDATIHADPARVSQALGNLLANAVEHGGGIVSLRGIRSGDRLRVEVADRGAGMRPNPRRGRGRGLRIVARAVEEAGGRFELTSNESGTVASLELPCAEA